MNRAELAELSAERDHQLGLRLAAWREGWRAGYAAGDAAGARRTARLWHVTVAGLPLSLLGPSWAELDRRRYPPAGRQGWIIARPGGPAGGSGGGR